MILILIPLDYNHSFLSTSSSTYKTTRSFSTEDHTVYWQKISKEFLHMFKFLRIVYLKSKGKSFQKIKNELSGIQYILIPDSSFCTPQTCINFLWIFPMYNQLLVYLFFVSLVASPPLILFTRSDLENSWDLNAPTKQSSVERSFYSHSMIYWYTPKI